MIVQCHSVTALRCYSERNFGFYQNFFCWLSLVAMTCNWMLLSIKHNKIQDQRISYDIEAAIPCKPGLTITSELHYEYGKIVQNYDIQFTPRQMDGYTDLAQDQTPTCKSIPSCTKTSCLDTDGYDKPVFAFLPGEQQCERSHGFQLDCIPGGPRRSNPKQCID